MDTHADVGTHFAHFINHLTVEKRYTALECSFVRCAAAVNSAERTNERADKMLRFRGEEEHTGIHIQVHKLNYNLIELKSVLHLILSWVADVNRGKSDLEFRCLCSSVCLLNF